MTIFFATRSQARSFAKTGANKKSVEKKDASRSNKQWGVVITK